MEMKDLEEEWETCWTSREERKVSREVVKKDTSPYLQKKRKN